MKTIKVMDIHVSSSQGGGVAVLAKEEKNLSSVGLAT